MPIISEFMADNGAGIKDEDDNHSDWIELGNVGAVPSILDGWFLTDWMDTERAQQALRFQHHSWPDMLVEMQEQVGWKRHMLRPVAPLARLFLSRRSLR